MATPDGDGPKPVPQPKSVLPAKAADRPEAFGRGDHPQPKRPADDEKKDGGQDPGGEAKQEGQTQQGHQKQGEDGKAHDDRPFWRRPVLMIVLVLVLLGGAAGGGYLGWWSYHYQSTDDAFIDGRIVRVAPRVAGKVLRLDVDDNVAVAADTVVIELDPQPFQVKLDQQRASELQAEAKLAEAQADQTVSEAQAAEADAEVVVAQANAHNAEQNLERYNRVSPQARSVQQLDSAVADQRSTAATVISKAKQADSSHAQAKAAATSVNAAIANVNVAKSQVAQAELDLSYTRVVAGYAGRLTRRQVEEGNYVSVGQEVVDVVPTQLPDIWVTANFKESQLAHMQRGQRVVITVDAYPDQKLHGHVDSVQNGTGAVFSLLPPENATGNFVKVVQRVPVKILLDDTPQHMLSPGMSVEPEVDITGHPNPSEDADVAVRPPAPTHVEPATPAP